MTQSPQKPKPSFAREVAGGVAKDTGKVLGVVAFQAISIIALIVLGAVVCGRRAVLRFVDRGHHWRCPDRRWCALGGGAAAPVLRYRVLGLPIGYSAPHG